MTLSLPSLIPALYAQAASAPAQPSMLETFILPLGIIVIMYFFVIRPQAKRQKEKAEVVKNLKVGDEVLTTAGFIGRIKSISDAFVVLDLAPNTPVKCLKSAVEGLAKSSAELKEAKA